MAHLEVTADALGKILDLPEGIEIAEIDIDWSVGRLKPLLILQLKGSYQTEEGEVELEDGRYEAIYQASPARLDEEGDQAVVRLIAFSKAD